MGKFVEEFDKVAAQINLKIKEAAVALEEANRLAYENGLRGLVRAQDEYLEFSEDVLNAEDADAEWLTEHLYSKINTGNLEDELYDGGWNISSAC